MSYQKWTPPVKPKWSPKPKPQGLSIVIGKNGKGYATVRTTLTRQICDSIQLAEFGAYDIYLDRERGCIGIEGVKNGLIKVKVPKFRTSGISVPTIREAIETFGLVVDRTILVPVHDVSDSKPPVQLEIRLDEVKQVLKDAKR